MNTAIGSTWNIWDLHVHTPASHTSHYGGEKEVAWNNFLNDIEGLPDSFKVLGINDYLFLDGYKRLIEEKKKGRLSNIELLLPVVEFRLRVFSGQEKLKKINFHVIFSNEVPPEQIESLFLGNLKLKLEPTQGKSFNRGLTKANLEEFGKRLLEDTPTEKRPNVSELVHGFDNATFDEQDIRDQLKHQEFEGKYITAIGKTEWYAIDWQQASADKKNLINNSNIVFSASPSPEQAIKSRDSLKAQRVNHKLFHCSDSHYPSKSTETNRMGHCFTWVKADPTFYGLRHAIEEYEHRTFIGDLPGKLALLRDHPTKFIKSLTIKKKPNSSLAERWFNSTINLNPDLVAIIGNKGSGKSALADFMGLLGNSPNEKYFSFLNENRFKEPKNRKASHFEAILTWHSGESVTRSLDTGYDRLLPKTAKYIPQSYLEIVCNSLGGSSETEFDREIKSVIFSHITEEDRLKKDSLDTLISFQTEETNKRIDLLKQKVLYLNKRLVQLEDSNSTDEVKRVQALLDRKKSELDALGENPQPISKPSQDGMSADLQSTVVELEKKQSELDGVKKRIQESSTYLRGEILRSSKLEKILKKLDNFIVPLSDFQSELEDDLNDFGIARTDIFSYKLDPSSLKNLQVKISSNISKAQRLLSKNDNASDFSVAAKLESEINELKFKLDEPNRVYQSQLKLLEEWKKNRASIIGDKDSPDTIEYYEGILANRKDLPKEIDQIRKARLDLTKRIFQEISKLSSVLSGYYSPIQEFLKEHQVAKEKFDFNFTVEHNIGHFEQNFIEFIDRSVTGEFSGKETSHKRLSDIVNSSEFNTEAGIVDFLNTITKSLVGSVGEASHSNVIRKQLRSSKSVEGLYDYLYSLDFLRPRYMLKADGKELAQLSPGQKGLLLLIFYLMIDKSDLPLIIDQPEENLDNQTVYKLLVPFIKNAKNRRQIIMVTHNPNLAVVCDAEQIIRSSLFPERDFEVQYESGSIENPSINRHIVDVLEGTYPAFDKRNQRYIEP